MLNLHAPSLVPRLVACALLATPSLSQGVTEATTEGSPSRIAFGSCLSQDRPDPIWDAVLAMQPDLWIWLGDNIYGDSDDPEALRAKWSALHESPRYTALREQCAVLGTWDDHDYGRNDAGAEYEHKAESQQLFLDFLGVSSDSPRRDREGVYHATTIGPPKKRVQVILLDVRYHRSPLTDVEAENRAQGIAGPYGPSTDPNATVLGEEQWQWLEQRLREPAELRVVASGIQLLAEEHGFEKWANFPRERARFLELVERTGANGVVVISGDRHAAEISRLTPRNDGLWPSYPLYDVTASALNRPSSWHDERNHHRVGGRWPEENFGLIEVDWERADPSVRLAIRDVTGRTVLRVDTTLSELTPGAPSDAPAPLTERRISRIAFGSCNDQRSETPLWDAVLAWQPDLFLFLGDNVYADTLDMEQLRDQYALLAAQPGYQRLRETTPVLATWDDHDYGANDAGSEYPMKAESKEVLLEFFEEPDDSPRRTRPGVYGSWLLGPAHERVQVILLDLRTFKDPWPRRADRAEPGDGHPGDYAQAEPGASPELLGEAQWAWLAEQLRTPARVRLIGTSLQALAEGSQWEGWTLFPRERRRLFRTIRESGANGVVLLSGDTHWGELARVDPADSGVAYPLWELTSSGLNQAWEFTNLDNPHRVGTSLWAPNWGAVEIDWEADDPRLSLRARAADGSEISVSLLLSDLSPR